MPPSRSPASRSRSPPRADAGIKRFEIRLDPPELGRIDVRLDVDRDGKVTSHLDRGAHRHARPPAPRRAAARARAAAGGPQDRRAASHFSLRDQSHELPRPGAARQRADGTRSIVPDDDSRHPKPYAATAACSASAAASTSAYKGANPWPASTLPRSPRRPPVRRRRTPRRRSPATANITSTIAGNFNTFLQLLTTQLKNQNPLDPLDTNQFTQQLVQFAQVEQQMNMNTQLTTLVSLQQAAQTTQALSFVGTTVDRRRRDRAAHRRPGDLELHRPTSPRPRPSPSRIRPADGL